MGNIEDKVISRDEVVQIFQNANFENVWARKEEHGKFHLYMHFFSSVNRLNLDKHYTDILPSMPMHFQAELIRLIKTDGKYSDGIQKGVYEFELVNIPELGFSNNPSHSHLNEMIYFDRNDFDHLFVIPVYSEDKYDYQLKNTIGLENTHF